MHILKSLGKNKRKKEVTTLKNERLIVPMNNNLDWATYLMNQEIRETYVKPKMGLDSADEDGKDQEEV